MRLSYTPKRTWIYFATNVSYRVWKNESWPIYPIVTISSYRTIYNPTCGKWSLCGCWRYVLNVLNFISSFYCTINILEATRLWNVGPFIPFYYFLKVCEEQKCEDAVLPLAVNFMDRFLSVCVIKRQQLQLLGATCLLIASKLRSANRLGIELLCTYTDNSVSYEHIFVSTCWFFCNLNDYYLLREWNMKIKIFF